MEEEWWKVLSGLLNLKVRYILIYFSSSELGLIDAHFSPNFELNNVCGELPPIVTAHWDPNLLLYKGGIVENIGVCELTHSIYIMI